MAIAFRGALVVALLGMIWTASLEKNAIHAPFLPHFVFVEDKGSLTVQGTWRREDGDDANPTQTTTIECDRATRRCLEASAVILGKDVMAPVAINTLPILKWDETAVVVAGAGARCVDEVYELHLSTKAVTGLITRKHDEFCDSTPGAEISKRPTRIRMIDGYEASWAARGFRKRPMN
jgi:hypothetical protein